MYKINFMFCKSAVSGVMDWVGVKYGRQDATFDFEGRTLADIMIL